MRLQRRHNWSKFTKALAGLSSMEELPLGARGAIIRQRNRDTPRVESLQGEEWEFERVGLRKD
jgi:hypothetical protein